MPAKVIPLIGKNLLMYLDRHPHEAETSCICLDKFPKKLGGPLEMLDETKSGWGIRLIEGLYWLKIWILVLAGFLTSIPFGTVWAMLKHDVQGGFAIATCLMVRLFFTTGIL